MRRPARERFELLDAILTSDIRPTAKIVGAYLWNRADSKTGICYPSVGTIANACGIEPRTVRYAIRQLEEAGLLTSSRPSGALLEKLKKSYHANCLPNVYIVTHRGGGNGRSPLEGDRGEQTFTPGGEREFRLGVNARSPKQPIEQPIEQPSAISSKNGQAKHWKTVCECLGSDTLKTGAFRAVWCDWERARQARRKPLTKQAVKLQVKRLEGLSLDEAVATVNQSIERGWATFYPNKEGEVVPVPHRHHIVSQLIEARPEWTNGIEGSIPKLNGVGKLIDLGQIPAKRVINIMREASTLSAGLRAIRDETGGDSNG